MEKRPKINNAQVKWVLIEHFIVAVIVIDWDILCSTFGAGALIVRLALIVWTASWHICNRVTSVGLITLRESANRIYFLRATGQIFAPLYILDQLSKILLLLWKHWAYLKADIICKANHIFIEKVLLEFGSVTLRKLTKHFTLGLVLYLVAESFHDESEVNHLALQVKMNFCPVMYIDSTGVVI